MGSYYHIDDANKYFIISVYYSLSARVNILTSESISVYIFTSLWVYVFTNFWTRAYTNESISVGIYII